MMQPVPYKAPAFTLKDATGVSHDLKDYVGKWVVLYFYPKDDTPGCTTEACSMRDVRDDLTDLGAVVLGVSRDEAASHEKFKTKYNLNFDLLIDANLKVMKLYGAWGKKQFGREGILRKTFIIDPNGLVQKIYGRVTPLGHGAQVVAELKKLQAEKQS
ncbi:MAG: peroxiredoxin [Candidatus Nanoperiomorbaceae bacterium]